MIQVLRNFTVDFDSGILAESIINAVPRTYLSTVFPPKSRPSNPLSMPIGCDPKRRNVWKHQEKEIGPSRVNPYIGEWILHPKEKNLPQKTHIIFVHFLLYSTHLPNNHFLLRHHSEKY